MIRGAWKGLEAYIQHNTDARFSHGICKTCLEEQYKELKKDKEALAKVIDEALEKVLKEKSASGESFGDRIKAGKLPGTNPEE